MDVNPGDVQAFESMMSEWIDEAFERLNKFREMFPPEQVGQLKYMVTLHVAIMQICEAIGAPPEMFSQLTTTLVAVWHASGKPEQFDFGVLKQVIEKQGMVH